MTNLGWIVECALQLRGGTVCSEFIIKDLSNPDINCKKWWSIVNRVCGGENSPSILPIVENEGTIFDSKEKACIFNEYFVLHTERPAANAIPPVIQL